MLTPDDSARLQRFDDSLIAFPPFVAAKEAIEENLQFFTDTGIARHMLVLGEAGTGKTSLCRWIMSKYPRIRGSEVDHIPLLFVRIPPLVNLGGVIDEFLRALGTFWSMRDNVTTKTAQIVLLCRKCGVRFVVLDEAQHFQDRGDAKSQYLVADWFKHLIDELAIPIVMMGVPRLEELLEGNEQLRRRFSRRVSLALAQSDGASITRESLQLFVSVASLTGIPLRAEPYDVGEFATRVYYATDGRVAYIKKLLFGALLDASRDDTQAIDIALLERAFRAEIWHDGVGRLNPFNPAFDLRPLDRRGEPFALPITGRRR